MKKRHQGRSPMPLQLIRTVGAPVAPVPCGTSAAMVAPGAPPGKHLAGFEGYLYERG